MNDDNKIYSDVDKKIAIIGLILSILLVIALELTKHNIVYDLTGALIGVSCLLWLYVRKKENNIKLQLPQRKTVFLICIFLFLLVFLGSILEIRFRQEQYERPILFFILTSAMAGIIGLEIFSIPDRSRRFQAIILIQIIVLGICFNLSESIIFPSVVGMDPWWHQMFTMKIIDSGHIPIGYHYTDFPVFHLEVALVSIVTILGYNSSSILSIGVIQVIVNILFVFLLANFFFNQRIGLMAGLFLILSNYHILAGFWIEPITIAATMTLIILYMLLKFEVSRPFKAGGLTMFLMITLILTHPIAAVFVAICLLTYLFLFRFYVPVTKGSRIRPVSESLTTLYLVLVLAVLISSWSIMTFLARQMATGFSSESSIPLPEKVLDYLSSIPIAEQLFNNIGLILSFALSLIGCFFMISRRQHRPYLIGLVIVSSIPLILSYSSLVTGHGIVESRWLYIAQIFLSIPLGLALLLLADLTKWRALGSFFIISISTLLAFLMIMSTVANIDNHSFSQESGVRVALTKGEIQAGITCQDAFNLTIGTDFYYANCLKYSSIPAEVIDDQILTGNFVHLNTEIILIREEIEVNPFYIFSTIPWRLDYNPDLTLGSLGFARVYDCGTVTGYL